MATQIKFSKLIDTDFSDGTLQGWTPQALNENSVMVVNKPDGSNGKCVRLHINYNEDFSNMGYGNVPRAAIAFDANKFLYEKNKDYLIKFKTFLPADFQYETIYENKFAIFDMHTTLLEGATPNGILIDKTNYQWNSNIAAEFSNASYLYKIINVGSILPDLGHWVEWVNYYRPSYSMSGRTVLWKNNQKIFDFNGYTAYKDVDTYQKFQLYKYAWQVSPTSTTDEVMYIADIQIFEG